MFDSILTLDGFHQHHSMYKLKWVDLQMLIFCRRYKDKKEGAVEPEVDPERDQRTVFAYQVITHAAYVFCILL